jgi:hypothetical protein
MVSVGKGWGVGPWGGLLARVDRAVGPRAELPPSRPRHDGTSLGGRRLRVGCACV